MAAHLKLGQIYALSLGIEESVAHLFIFILVFPTSTFCDAPLVHVSNSSRNYSATSQQSAAIRKTIRWTN